MERPKKIFTRQIKTIRHYIYGKRKGADGEENYGKFDFNCKKVCFKPKISKNLKKKSDEKNK